jgi:hypothetical protein
VPLMCGAAVRLRSRVDRGHVDGSRQGIRPCELDNVCCQLNDTCALLLAASQQAMPEARR